MDLSFNTQDLYMEHFNDVDKIPFISSEVNQFANDNFDLSPSDKFYSGITPNMLEYDTSIKDMHYSKSIMELTNHKETLIFNLTNKYFRSSTLLLNIFITHVEHFFVIKQNILYMEYTSYLQSLPNYGTLERLYGEKFLLSHISNRIDSQYMSNLPNIYENRSGWIVIKSNLTPTLHPLSREFTRIISGGGGHEI